MSLALLEEAGIRGEVAAKIKTTEIKQVRIKS